MKYVKTEPYFTAIRDSDLQNYTVVEVYLTEIQDFYFFFYIINVYNIHYLKFVKTSFTCS